MFVCQYHVVSTVINYICLCVCIDKYIYIHIYNLFAFEIQSDKGSDRKRQRSFLHEFTPEVPTTIRFGPELSRIPA